MTVQEEEKPVILCNVVTIEGGAHLHELHVVEEADFDAKCDKFNTLGIDWVRQRSIARFPKLSRYSPARFPGLRVAGIIMIKVNRDAVRGGSAESCTAVESPRTAAPPVASVGPVEEVVVLCHVMTTDGPVLDYRLYVVREDDYKKQDVIGVAWVEKKAIRCIPGLSRYVPTYLKEYRVVGAIGLYVPGKRELRDECDSDLV